jgi:hypothetical protein
MGRQLGVQDGEARWLRKLISQYDDARSAHHLADGALGWHGQVDWRERLEIVLGRNGAISARMHVVSFPF